MASCHHFAGLSSIDAVQLTAALQQALGRELPPTLAFDYPTVASLVAFLASGRGAVAPQPAADVPTEVIGADRAPQRSRDVLHQTPQPHAAARAQIAVVASDLRLPGAGVSGGESMFHVDRSVLHTTALCSDGSLCQTPFYTEPASKPCGSAVIEAWHSVPHPQGSNPVQRLVAATRSRA